MSHAAIVCREYGLPAVVGTGRATAEIRTGQKIRVDGSTGVVTILDGHERRLHPFARRPAANRRRRVRRQEREPRRPARRRASRFRPASRSARTPSARSSTDAGLGGLIAASEARAAGGDVEAVAAASKAIDEAMRFAPLPDEVRAEIVAGYAELGADEPPVAVRSSAIGEDSAEATFAGQQESFLWVRASSAGLRRSARLLGQPVHAAGDELPGDAPRRGRGEPAMGVTVQLMVDAEVSGVLFTCNPVSGDPSMVAVNASWGLGLAVVGGEVTPDDYLVSKVTGEVVRREIGSKHVEYVPDAEGQGDGPSSRSRPTGRPSRVSARRSSRRSSRSRSASSGTSAHTRTSSGRSRAAGRCPSRSSSSRRGP